MIDETKLHLLSTESEQDQEESQQDREPTDQPSLWDRWKEWSETIDR
ncbi:MAG: hypothetical protein HN368_03600 [Spirochaetales bacterium]|nr:hypothetical protein [Spirochaetales bacterium]